MPDANARSRAKSGLHVVSFRCSTELRGASTPISRTPRWVTRPARSGSDTGGTADPDAIRARFFSFEHGGKIPSGPRNTWDRANRQKPRWESPGTPSSGMPVARAGGTLALPAGDVSSVASGRGGSTIAGIRWPTG